MAYSSAALASRETTYFAADKPLVAVNAIVSPSTKKWTETGTVAATDRTLAANPAARAYDGLPGLLTKPDSTAASTWYLVFDMGTTGIEFDCAFLIGHNFGTLALTTVQLQIANAADFATDLVTIGDFGAPANDDRLADYVLHSGGGSALRYSTVRYVRLKLSKGGNFTPQLGELVLGRRRQFDRKPDRPFDDYGLHNEVDVTKTLGGLSLVTAHFRNQFRLDAEWPIESSDYQTDWQAFWTGCNGAFVWCYSPTSAPASWHLMARDQEDIDLGMIGPYERTAKLEAVEQGPSLYFLANE
jgi:hypothetical protein